MPIRNSHRVGDYLMTDDESGLVHYRSEMVRRWDGLWVRADQYETRHPQEFVHARSDPKPLRHVRPEELSPTPTTPAGCVGETTVVRPASPAQHIFGFLDVLLDENDGPLLDESGNCLVEET